MSDIINPCTESFVDSTIYNTLIRYLKNYNATTVNSDRPMLSHNHRYAFVCTREEPFRRGTLDVYQNRADHNDIYVKLTDLTKNTSKEMLLNIKVVDGGAGLFVFLHHHVLSVNETLDRFNM